MSAYGELAAAAADVGWPLSYATDLTEHDRARLDGTDPPITFGWVLRELGTELLDPRMDLDSLQGYLAHYRGYSPGNLYHWWDGAKLHSMSFARWAERMLQENAPDGGKARSCY